MALRIERRMVPHVPWGLLGSAVLLALLGIYNLASAARDFHTKVASAQAAYLGLGLLVVLAATLVDYRFFARMALPIYVLNILALVALRYLGHKAKGAESWFVLGPLRVQPAEFMKIGLLLMLAKHFHEDFRPSQEPYGLLQLWKPIALTVLPFVLVLTQPDLGTALMILLTAVTVVLFARVKVWVVAVMVGTLLAASVVIWNDYLRDPSEHHVTLLRHRLKKHQDKRISGWLDPESDPKGANYHAAQSKIAVGSGGLWGRGWRQGTQTGLRFLPEQHTDFVFSVWAEEQGFFRCILLLVLYGVLLVAALGVAFSARDLFGAFFAVGVASMIFWQVFENIGMVTGLLPVTGITLPLLSYGGSSLLSVMICLGLLVNIAVRRHIF